MSRRLEHESLLYPLASAHVRDELCWLNRVLAAEVLRLRRDNFYASPMDFRRFFIADEEIDALFAAGVFEREDGNNNDSNGEERRAELLRQARTLRGEIDRRVQKSLEHGVLLPLAQLKKCFQLSEAETQALVICLAPKIDARYEKIYAYLQNDFTKKFASIDLILGLLCQSFEERWQLLPCFSQSAPLRRFRLLESTAEESNQASAAQAFLAVASRIFDFVLGQHLLPMELRTYVHLVSALKWKEVVITESLRTQLHKVVRAAAEKQIVLYLHGRHGVGKKTIARALCGEIGADMLVVDVRALLRPPETFAENIGLILREGMLQSCPVYFDHWEKLQNAESNFFLTCLRQELNEWGRLAFLGSQTPLVEELMDNSGIIPFEIPAPDHAAQQRLWQQHLNGAFAEAGATVIDQLAAHFDLTGGQIARAARQINHSDHCHNAENGKPTINELLMICRRQSQLPLGGLAQKINPVYDWGDLILPEDALAQLHEICQRVRHRHRVLQEWGFGRKLSQGKGINALFAGPSGTGKTMAAEIIANELQLDLYKIDLAGVVSKYIGETEKKLNRIFAAAEHSNAILFFDEADALFGKRSEVRDSHDRYANIEISYLLQKMEQHEGVTILATNLRQNLDESFTRRLAFTIHFPFPDENSRQRIWKGMWPNEIPLAKEVDVELLARRFKLSGGNIKNIALAAAFLAADDGGVITMPHLFQTIRREYQKMGKVLNEEELGSVAQTSSLQTK